MIQLDRLGRRYADTVALDNVSLEVKRGEVLGLLGPNGAGKTTCLRVLTCYLPPTSGEAWVDGLSIRRQSREVRQRLGYLPEGVPLHPELRVTEHLRFRAGLLGLKRRGTQREVDRVVGLCNLGDVRRQIVGTLSRGFRQRLGLALTLLGDPPLLVLDEPTVGLDPNQVREVRELIRSLGGEHTILLSTHVLPEVEAVCSRAAVINRGRMVACGEVGRLLAGGGAEVTVRGDPGQIQTALEAIDEVERVEALTDDGELHRFRLHGIAGNQAREQVAVAVAEAGFGLSDLSDSVSSLEDVFAQLTNAAEEQPEEEGE